MYRTSLKRIRKPPEESADKIAERARELARAETKLVLLSKADPA